MKKSGFTLLLCFIIGLSQTGEAWAREVVTGGRPVGISVSADGVLVGGLSPVDTQGGSVSPAEKAGLCAGDLIIEANGKRLSDSQQLICAVRDSGGREMRLTAERGGEEKCFTVTPVQGADGQWMLGLLLRDGISGIGTVTFYDRQTGIYGALGHSISADSGGSTLKLDSGFISDAQIVSVEPAAPDAPGELNGCADVSKVLGSIDANTAVGIFGISTEELDGETVETGEMCVGEASILTTLDGSQPREYSITVDRLYQQREGTYALLTVTDSRLIRETGGIVQGMSGSPILQNGRLVGAVTHVFVSDSTKGYGVSIADMLRASGIAA